MADFTIVVKEMSNAVMKVLKKTDCKQKCFRDKVTNAGNDGWKNIK